MLLGMLTSPLSCCRAPRPSSHTLCPSARRWIRDAKELRLQRKVQRMRLQSDAAQLQRELHQLQSQLQAERSTQQSLEQQLREVQRARLAHNASQSGWQLGAVQLYHNRVVQATPVKVSGLLLHCKAVLHMMQQSV